MNLKTQDIFKLKQDDYISDIIDIEIDSRMSLSTLYALETILCLRLQLAQASFDRNEPIIEALCHDRFERLAAALKEKYATVDTLNSKIEILERIEVLSLHLTGGHSECALEEASIIEEEPNLTYAQRLRLKWLPSLTPEDDSKIVAELLPHTAGSFEMATLALISDFCTEEERSAIFNRYFEMFDAAIATGDTAELGNLLALAAYWNNTPSMRSRLTHAADQAASIEALSLPEKRVNALAADIYTQIAVLTGKYADVEDIPA